MNLLRLLHLCDSLFPVGAFAYSDGLETATVRRQPDRTGVRRPGANDSRGLTPNLPRPDATGVRPPGADDSRGLTPNLPRPYCAPVVADAEGLRAWIDVCLDETLGRMEGPAVWQAWPAFREAAWNTLVTLDEELAALRPSSSARRASRAMGRRLLTTWQTLYPDPRLAHALTLERGVVPLFQGPPFGPALPIAFAGACACAGIDRRRAVEAFAYTRLAATISAAMRLMPIGQTDAHALLARTLERVPAALELVASRDGRIESFSPAVDIAAMTQQYLHSRLFRS